MTTTPNQRRVARDVSMLAAVLIIVTGTVQALEGLSAIIDDKMFVVADGYAFQLDTTTWGWLHLLFGVALVAVGAAIFSGQAWARMVGILLAALSVVANFLWLPYYPIWAILIIALDVFVIWALAENSDR
ncbi:hypothetical protein [Skermania piniformis]|uniref:DUF7144 domain-containing protein n=1 Tax=Skermania pinensis TaxID=39122 RepID=A0ABX8SA98_9ACTN|nr:hypothetical protein [Skermania piniformis]QXQ14774.1 hypothetical protein KV203_05150 [Skermania piniformis]